MLAFFSFLIGRVEQYLSLKGCCECKKAITILMHSYLYDKPSDARKTCQKQNVETEIFVLFQLVFLAKIGYRDQFH